MQKDATQPKLSQQPQKTQPAQTSQSEGYWQQMINGIVRPPRAKYSKTQLGSRVVLYKDKSYIRNQASLQHDGKKLQITIYEPDEAAKQKIYTVPFVILYMHGNSSCRVQALSLIRDIPIGVALAAFDFMGCGKNQEISTISLGYREAQQAKTVAQFLRKEGYRVILWGRSMGAASALLYGDAEFIVADSSYKSFKSLCKQVAKQHSPKIVPNFMINCFFPCVFSKMKVDVGKKANYDIQFLDVKQAVLKLNPATSVVFMSGNKDILINKRNSQKLFDACPCKKKYLKLFDGDHNTKRPETVLAEVMGIIQKHIISNQPSVGVINLEK